MAKIIFSIASMCEIKYFTNLAFDFQQFLGLSSSPKKFNLVIIKLQTILDNNAKISANTEPLRLVKLAKLQRGGVAMGGVKRFAFGNNKQVQTKVPIPPSHAPTTGKRKTIYETLHRCI